MVMRRNMDVVANNLANMSTTSYKSEKVLFEEYLIPVEDEYGDEYQIHLVQDYGVVRNMDEGRFQHTDNPFDIALKGKGYLVLENDEGDQFYTRNGHLRISDEGFLTASSGDYLLDDAGQRIRVEQGETNFHITKDGDISTSGGPKGKLQTVMFENEQELEKFGAGRFKTEQATIPVESLEFVQGMIEESNVNPILEMTRMIEISRSYQSAAKLMQTNDDLTRKAIEELGKF